MVKIDIAKPLMLSSDYDKIFSNNVVVIVGLSRSRTSVLGKIVGSIAIKERCFFKKIMKELNYL